MAQQKAAVCSTCKHFNLFGEHPSCTAFETIPDAIWKEGKPHDKVLPGQKKPVVFEKEDRIPIS